MINSIEKFFYELILKERQWIINKCERKITKYRNKYNFYVKYLEDIKKETDELLEKGTYM